MRRLTLGGKNRYPVWSPDGQRIAFQSDRDGDPAIFWQRADGTGTPERLSKPEQGTAHVPESWSPDGKWLLLSATKESDGRSVAASVVSMMLSLDDRKALPFDDVRSNQPINAAFSPDGKWIAYTTRAPGSVAQIYVQPFPPTGGAVYQITRGTDRNAHHPFWSRDGRELYYIPAAGAFAFVSITTRPTFGFSDPVPLSRGPNGFFEGGPGYTRQNDAADDGRVIAVMAGNPSQAGVGEGATTPQFHVVLNWFEELKARVPAR
jgi:Tol biopolymer transport system component